MTRSTACRSCTVLTRRWPSWVWRTPTATPRAPATITARLGLDTPPPESGQWRKIKVQRFSFQHCLYTASIFDILFYAFIRWTVTHLSPFDIKCRACEEEIISCVCVFKMFQLIDAAHPATFPKNVFVGIKPVSILTWRSIRYSWSWNLKARNSSKFSQVF